LLSSKMVPTMAMKRKPRDPKHIVCTVNAVR
jgi:hypothetical protein